MRDLWIWLIIAAVAGFLAAYLVLQPGRERTLTPQAVPAPKVLLDEPAKGAENAPVTIIEFADFRCGFCLRHFVQTLPALEEEYIARLGRCATSFATSPFWGCSRAGRRLRPSAPTSKGTSGSTMTSSFC
jgi:protein-disulfide isomerase